MQCPGVGSNSTGVLDEEALEVIGGIVGVRVGDRSSRLWRSDIPALDSEDAALRGGIPASENGKGHGADGIAGSNGSNRVDKKHGDVDAGVDDRCVAQAKGASSMHVNDTGKGKAGVSGTEAKGKSGDCRGAKDGDVGAGKDLAKERGKAGDKGSEAHAASDDAADDDGNDDEDQTQDENSDN
jgi:hypothetical protein